MASNLVFSGTNGITLYAVKEGQAAADRIMWKTVTPSRASGWKTIAYTGYDGLDGQWLGRKPIRYLVEGYINADNTSDFVTLYGKVLDLGKDETAFSVTGPIAVASPQAAIVENIDFRPISAGGIIEFQFIVTEIGSGA